MGGIHLGRILQVAFRRTGGALREKQRFALADPDGSVAKPVNGHAFYDKEKDMMLGHRQGDDPAASHARLECDVIDLHPSMPPSVWTEIEELLI
jgi:hypothetical protein